MPAPLTAKSVIYDLPSPGDPDVSPDGRNLTYTLGVVDGQAKKATSQVWICGVDGSNARRLTWNGDRNRSARWSPDGAQLAFVSDRVEKNGLFVMPMEGGEARELCRHANPIGDVAWSPDGKRIAYTSLVDPANPNGEKPAPDAPPPVRVTSRIDYKQDNRGYLGDARMQVFVVDVATGERRQVTSEAIDHGSPQWSPDGASLAIRTSVDNGMVSHLQVLSLEGGEAAAKVVGGDDFSLGTWAWSPDGTRLILAADYGNTYQLDFYLYDVASGALDRLTDDLQCLPYSGFPTIEPPSQPRWLDGHRVLFHANHRGASGLWVFDLETREATPETGGQNLTVGFSADSANRFVAQTATSLESPAELVVTDRETGKTATITSYSLPLTTASPMAEWERFDVPRGKYVVEAWMLKPPGFDAAKQYPVVLDIHGGPNGFYGYAFNAIQQVLATNGYIVVFSNPRGSSSYGREFTQQVTKDWGGEDYHDLMAVMDEALKRPYCDPARTGIWGYSYGGFMTAWTISQNHRFKAAVCGAPCFDLESMFGTSDISHKFGPLQWGGAPYEDREWYATHSPSQFAHNTRTPTLIVQGEADERCPVGQGEQMFVTLKKAGCEVEFARYPGASHLFMRTGPAEHREDVIARVLGWFDSHL